METFAKGWIFRYNPIMLDAAPAPSRHSLLRVLGEFLRLAIVAAAIALPIRYFIAQPFIVRGASMEPNFREREYLIIDELSYFFREPIRGEVIVFRYPANPKEYFIKRVIGLPGETVEINTGGIFVINETNPEGFRLSEPYIAPGVETRGSARFSLGSGEYVVLGDNRPSSSDSRGWGILDKKFITGRAVFRVFPVQRLGIVAEP
ncbi:MAG: signal peptidase I [Candidatus Sungbacteria bacterium]|nr:signal peptidase I [Candidatus Sungbacteria bacterium]